MLEQKTVRTIFRYGLNLLSLTTAVLLLMCKAYLEKEKSAAEKGSVQNGALRI